MMHLYSDLLYTQTALQSCGGSLLNNHQCAASTTLLDFAVILQLLTVKKYSKIPYIWFTVNYCNTHCIMGISVLILQ